MKEKMIEDNWWYPDFLKAGEAPQQPNHTLSIQVQHDGISPPCLVKSYKFYTQTADPSKQQKI